MSELAAAVPAIDDPAILARAATATFRTDVRVPLIFRPESLDQIVECVRAAGGHRIRLYPVSTGKNWGYGSSVPAGDDCAIVDLGGLNRIVDFNETLGYVTVEPGVTQRQLFSFLKENGSRLWMDATGSSPDCSLIGNTLERGFGHTPYGDHFDHVCGMEVVLPTGSVMRTGFGGLPGAKASEVYRWGVGPVLDGLFTQSNFGIVTKMTFWLMPAPEYFQAYFFQCRGEESPGSLIDTLRPLRMSGVLRSTVHIANDYKVLNGIQQFPAGEDKPLSRDAMRRHREKLKFGRWSGSGALYGTKGQVAEARRILKRALTGKTGKLQFLDERTLNLATRFTKPFRFLTGMDLSRTLDLVRPVFNLMKGEPTGAMLPSAYWRKGSPAPVNPDPDRDGCGLIWCAPVSPAEGTAVTELVGIAEDILLEHGFEPMISLTMIAERSVACVISIAYDREVQGEDHKAMTCYRELESRLAAHGFYPYRLGIQSMDLLERDPVKAAFLAALKRTIDPHNILAPGRYVTGQRQPTGGRS